LNEQRVGIEAGKAEIEGLRKPIGLVNRAMTDNPALPDARNETNLQAIAESAHSGQPLLCSAVPKFERCGKTDGESDGRSARAEPLLLSATQELRFQRCSSSNEQRANSRRPVEFVGAGRKRRHPHLTKVDRDPAYRLHRVAMKDDPSLSNRLSDGRDRLNASSLIVGEHQGRDASVLTETREK
jgi:hypothetical protein